METIKKIIFGSFMVFSLSSCFVFHEEYIDPQLEPYWQTFQYEAERLGVNLPNKSIILKLKDNVGATGMSKGHCNWTPKTCTIDINTFYMPKDGSYSLDQEATIFHELGHGLFRRPHMEPREGDEFEESLMTIPARRKYYIDGSKREYYLRELFGLHQ